MFVFLLIRAFAADQLLPSEWTEIRLIEQWDPSALRGDAAWRSGSCRPMKLFHGLDTIFRSEWCNPELDGGYTRNAKEGRLDIVWVEPPTEGERIHADGSVGQGFIVYAGTSDPNVWRLTGLSPSTATWQYAFQAHAEAKRYYFDIHPCDPSTLPDIVEEELEPTRACATSEGVEAIVGMERRAGISAVTERVYTEPVDCMEPCPPDPNAPLVEMANAALQGRWFTNAEKPPIQIFVDREACLATLPAGDMSEHGVCPPSESDRGGRR